MLEATQEGRNTAKAMLDSAQAEVRSAEAEVAAAQADADYWRAEIARMKTLLDQGAVSKQEYQESKAEADKAEAELRRVAAAETRVSGILTAIECARGGVIVVVHGEAAFRFRHVLSGASHVVRTSARHPEVVESIPGWAHDVTNVGDDVMVAVVWASERFDRNRPDTVAMAL